MWSVSGKRTGETIKIVYAHTNIKDERIFRGQKAEKDLEVQKENVKKLNAELHESQNQIEIQKGNVQKAKAELQEAHNQVRDQKGEGVNNAL